MTDIAYERARNKLIPEAVATANSMSGSESTLAWDKNFLHEMDRLAMSRGLFEPVAKGWLDMEGIKKYLSVRSDNTVMRYVNHNGMPHARLRNGDYRFKAVQVDRWMIDGQKKTGG